MSLWLLLCLLSPVAVLASTASDCRRANTAERVIECYLPFIMETAIERDINPALVLAIMQQESRFSLHARSQSNALGLMQIVPASGGRDVMRFFSGKAATLPDQLVLDPILNIELGIAFIYLLKSHYLSGISDDSAQRYAVIAAYNGGIGTLRRWYGTDKLSLVERVNANSAEYFKLAILANHPFHETRDYLERVDDHYQFYQSLLQQHIEK